jgi:hypothetical protein
VHRFARAMAATGLFLATFAWAGCSGGGTAAAPSPDNPTPANDAFASPQKVTIAGYTGTAMEPFVSRDGKYLFFNDSNAAGNDTNLYWATRTNALLFQFQGQIGGVNSPMLDAVASMDLAGNFYFISNRSYATTASTVYHGTFSNGVVTGIALVPGISLQTPGIVTFDEEVSADGGTLYIAEGDFSGGNGPASSRIIVAHGSATGGFTRDPNSATILQNVNARPTSRRAGRSSSSRAPRPAASQRTSRREPTHRARSASRSRSRRSQAIPKHRRSRRTARHYTTITATTAARRSRSIASRDRIPAHELASGSSRPSCARGRPRSRARRSERPRR